MITAKEARSLTTKKRNDCIEKDIKEIEEGINSSVKDGFYDTGVVAYFNYNNEEKAVIKKHFADLGYSVSFTNNHCEMEIIVTW